MLLSSKKKGMGTSRWNLDKLTNGSKLKSNYINKKRKWLMKIGMKIGHGQARNNSILKTHHDMDLGRVHHFLLIVYFVIGDGGCIKMVKSPMSFIKLIKIL
jgi:hypothetical protein